MYYLKSYWWRANVKDNFKLYYTLFPIDIAEIKARSLSSASSDYTLYVAVFSSSLEI